MQRYRDGGFNEAAGFTRRKRVMRVHAALVSTKLQ